jgi:hypothetical protein
MPITVADAINDINWTMSHPDPVGEDQDEALSVARVIYRFLNNKDDAKQALRALQAELRRSDAQVEILKLPSFSFKRGLSFTLKLRGSYIHDCNWFRNKRDQSLQIVRDEFEQLLQRHQHSLAEMRQEFVRNTTSTKPADREGLEKAVRAIYSKIGLAAPRMIWFDSCRDAIIAAGMLCKIWEIHEYDSQRHSRQVKPSGDGFFDSSVNNRYHLYDFVNAAISRYTDCGDIVEPAIYRCRHTSSSMETGSQDFDAAAREIRKEFQWLLRKDLDRILSIDAFLPNRILLAIRQSITVNGLEAMQEYGITCEAKLDEEELQRISAVPKKHLKRVAQYLARSLDDERVQLFIDELTADRFPGWGAEFRGITSDNSFWYPGLLMFHSPLSLSLELMRIAALKHIGLIESEAEAKFFFDALQAGGWWAPYLDVCLLCDNPTICTFDDSFRLHNDSGPSLSLAGDETFFALGGLLVPEKVVTRNYNVEDIDAERNVEVRRVMIERYGVQAYIKDIGALEIDRSEWGVLFRKELKDDEAIVMVEVTNKTAEPDGSYKNYFLRVPPQMMTAKEAVSWTFGISDPREYRPAVET